MDLYALSPNVRVARYSVLKDIHITTRNILDYEIIYIHDGQCLFTIEGREYICKKNDAIFIRPNQTHSIRCLGTIPLNQPHIHFDAIYDEYSPNIFPLFKRYDELTDSEKKMMRKDVFEDVSIPSVFPIESVPGLREYIIEIINIFNEKDDFYYLQCREKMLAVLRLLLEKFSTSLHKRPNIRHEIVDIKGFIDHSYKNIITLDDLASHFYVSKYYLTTQFKLKYGVSVIKYYNISRIKEAKKLLDTGMRVTDVSKELNFGSIYLFSRFFKNYTDISPTQYQNQKNG